MKVQVNSLFEILWDKDCKLYERGEEMKADMHGIYRWLYAFYKGCEISKQCNS